MNIHRVIDETIPFYGYVDTIGKAIYVVRDYELSINKIYITCGVILLPLDREFIA